MSYIELKGPNQTKSLKIIHMQVYSLVLKSMISKNGVIPSPYDKAFTSKTSHNFCAVC
jgi:hypothetical protein